MRLSSGGDVLELFLFGTALPDVVLRVDSFKYSLAEYLRRVVSRLHLIVQLPLVVSR